MNNSAYINNIKIGDRIENFEVLELRSVTRGKTSPRREVQVLCRCKCGKEKWYPKYDITRRGTKSCGCASRVKHGYSNTRIYGIWRDMKRRCDSPSCATYRYYGARGIKVCEQWNNIVSFKDWAFANGYSDNLTLDRIDVNGNYCPENCRWVTMKVQQNNKRSIVYIEYNGVSKTISQWAEFYKCDAVLLRSRMAHGWSFEEAVGIKEHISTRRVVRKCRIKMYHSELNNEYYSVEDVSRMTGKSIATAYRHISMCYGDVDKVLSKPKNIPWWKWSSM